jgi:A118 family predicted phage portal protein
MDFKLGQKIMVINKKLVKIEQEEYTDEEGNIKTRPRVVYPTDVQKQLFTEMGTDIMSDTSSQPYIYEYNPDLRVGDNKEGIQFALDNLSFKLGYGTHYYSFENGNLVTATEAVLSRQDFVSNGRKVRECVNEYLLGICRALLSCERMLGTAVDEKQDIEVEEVDGFLEDDETQRQKLLEDVSAGLISKTTYLKKVYKLNDDEIVAELDRINSEDNSPDVIDEDMGE